MPTVDIPDKICSHCGDTKWYVLLNGKIDCCIYVKREKQKKYKQKIKHDENFKKKRCFYAKNRYNRKSEEINKNIREKRATDPIYKQKNIENSKKYYHSNKDKILTSFKEKMKDPIFYKKYREKFNKDSIKRFKELSNTVIKQCIVSDLRRTNHVKIEHENVPPELVEIKRNQLLLKRKIKNNDNKEEQHSN